MCIAQYWENRKNAVITIRISTFLLDFNYFYKQQRLCKYLLFNLLFADVVIYQMKE